MPSRTVVALRRWDHVQDRGCSAASKVGEAVHAGNVRCIAGEADDESPRGFGAEPFLKPRHRPENVENICSGGELRAVLAYLELGEVKAKRLRLPDEVLHLAERDPLRARRFQ